MKQIFEFENYKSYLKDRLKERGSQSRIAIEMDCQPAYLSIVINGSNHLSLEQGEAANRFFRHDEFESEFFLQLISLQRAGTVELKERLKKRLNQLKRQSLDLRQQLKTSETLNLEQASVYYSAWYYAAIHAAVSVPENDSINKVATRLALPNDQVEAAIRFLIQSGVLEQNPRGKGWRPAKVRIHLGADSPLVLAHHSHWRMKAIENIGRRDDQSLHYSSVVSMSHEDYFRIRETLLTAIRKSKEIIKESKDENIFGFNVDLFQV